MQDTNDHTASPVEMRVLSSEVLAKGLVLNRKLAKEINALFTEADRHVANAIVRTVEAGRLLLAAKLKAPPKKWLDELTQYRIDARKAQRAMDAARRFETDPRAKLDFPAFAASVWGNKPKTLKDKEAGGENLPKQKQSGGLLLSGFTNKGKPEVRGYTDFVREFNRFFESPSYTDKAKVELIDALVGYLEDRRALYAGESEELPSDDSDGEPRRADAPRKFGAGLNPESSNRSRDAAVL
jgi:hypothetical protein